MEHGGSDPLDAALRALGEALQVADGPPDQVISQAKAIFTWRTIDAELAELTFDSSVDGELAGVRGSQAARNLTFETAAVVIDAEISPAGGGFDVVGSLMPAADATFAYQRPDGDEVAVTVDDLGRFRLDGLTAGNLRFVVRAGDGARVVTDWFAL